MTTEVKYAICKAYYNIGAATENGYVMWLSEEMGAVSRWICDFREAKFFSKEEIDKIDTQKLITQENEKLTIVAVNITDTTNDG
jgi:hypothetical protein